MKKTVKIIYSILLLSIFLLFSILLFIPRFQLTKDSNSKGESITYYSVDLNSTTIQSLFNEEELDDFKRDFIVSSGQFLFLNPNSFALILIDNKNIKCLLHSIFALQNGLPPPETGVFLI
ncbi:MAG TPA: hypothetical protein VKA38_11020 [Draconibacterium sp.]|nr:hypothetical protein [Draconibacterium sp.]